MYKVQAYRVYFSINKCAGKTLKRLLVWNGNGTLTSNAKRMGLKHVGEACVFAKRYGLPYRRHISKKVDYALSIKELNILRMYTAGCTLGDVGSQYHVSRERVRQWINEIVGKIESRKKVKSRSKTGGVNERIRGTKSQNEEALNTELHSRVVEGTGERA